MRQNPRMYVVDDLQSVRVLSNRVLTYDMLRNCLAPHAHLLLRAPTHAVIHSGDVRKSWG